MPRYTDRQKTILTFRKIKGVIQEGQLPQYLRSGFDLSAIEEEGGLIDHVNDSTIHLDEADVRTIIDAVGYLLLDQTSPETIENGIPLLAAQISDFNNEEQIVNKRYVDNAINFIADYYWNETADPIGGIYYQMTEKDLGEAGSTLTSGTLGSGDDQPLFNFISTNGIGTDKVNSGVYELHFHANKTGTKPVSLYSKLYIRTTGGTETLVATSNISDPISLTDEVYDLVESVPAEVDIDPTDRIVVKLFANVGATGSNVTVTFSLQGSNNSRISIPVESAFLQQIFLRQDGATPLKGNWDVGGFSITNIGKLEVDDVSDIFKAEVQIFSASDFPTASGGVHDLAGNTLYRVIGAVNIGTNQLNWGDGTVIRGNHRANDQIIYTGTGAAITNTNNHQINMSEFAIVAPAGKAMDVDMGSEFLTVDWITFISLDGVHVANGNVHSFKTCLFGDPTGAVSSNNHLTFTGSIDKVFVDSCPFYSLSAAGVGILFDETTIDIIHLESNFFKFGDGTWTAIDWSHTTLDSPANFGNILGNTFDGVFTKTANFDQKTPGWDFEGNGGIPNSTVTAGWSFSGNTTETTIATQNAWVKVTGASAFKLQRMTFASDTLTSTGKRKETLHAVVAITSEATANNAEYEFAFFINGVVDSDTITSVSYKFSGEAESKVLNNLFEVEEDDEIDLRVRCTSGTDNILITTLNGTLLK